jgi:uncharacterized membrane protein
VLALLTAGSFLFLAGVSLWLGHGAGIRWRGFWRRFVKVAGAAAVITAATWVAMGDVFIFFGILHAIAAASLLGLLFLRVPVVGLLALTALAFAAPSFARAEVFDPWWMWWTGLQTVSVRSVDYVPLAPWFGPFLLGMALGRAGSRFGLWSRLAAWRGGAWAERLALPGRLFALGLPGASAGADRPRLGGDAASAIDRVSTCLRPADPPRGLPGARAGPRGGVRCAGGGSGRGWGCSA